MNFLSPPLQDSLAKACLRFEVERLYLFGSKARGNFDASRSDLDFLVSLRERPPAQYAENYLGLADELEKLFGRSVDLVTENSIRNPYFRENVFAERQLLYEHSHAKAVA